VPATSPQPRKVCGRASASARARANRRAADDAFTRADRQHSRNAIGPSLELRKAPGRRTPRRQARDRRMHRVHGPRACFPQRGGGRPRRRRAQRAARGAPAARRARTWCSGTTTPRRRRSKAAMKPDSKNPGFHSGRLAAAAVDLRSHVQMVNCFELRRADRPHERVGLLALQHAVVVCSTCIRSTPWPSSSRRPTRRREQSIRTCGAGWQVTGAVRGGYERRQPAGRTEPNDLVELGSACAHGLAPELSTLEDTKGTKDTKDYEPHTDVASCRLLRACCKMTDRKGSYPFFACLLPKKGYDPFSQLILQRALSTYSSFICTYLSKTLLVNQKRARATSDRPDTNTAQ